jgi:hypothetical protein
MGARYFMTVVFSSTYCIVMLGCTLALFFAKLQVETYIALIGGFALVVKEIANDYFDRNDRSKQEDAK